MITLRDVSKAYGSGSRRRVVLDRISVLFDGSADVGILGANGAGKSTLLRILAGMELPDSGRVERRARVSFPLGYSGGFHPNLTGRENVRFIARLFGADADAVIRFVRDFAEIGRTFDQPLTTYSNNMRARVTFATSLAIEFDIYLVDEITSVGDVNFKRRCIQAFEERRRASPIIMVSQATTTLGRLCRAGAILDEARLHVFPTLKAAIAAYENNLTVIHA